MVKLPDQALAARRAISRAGRHRKDRVWVTKGRVWQRATRRQTGRGSKSDGTYYSQQHTLPLYVIRALDDGAAAVMPTRGACPVEQLLVATISARVGSWKRTHLVLGAPLCRARF